MKTFKWKLNFDFLEEDQRPKEQAKWFENALIGALISRYKDGVSISNQRLLFNIINKIELSEKGLPNDTVTLEDAEFELIKEAFMNGKFNPAGFRVSCQIAKNIDEAT